MKSRTSFFNFTVFRKDITRFAPAWGLYLVGMLLIMLGTADSTEPMYSAQSLGEVLGPFSVINLIYAALCVQLLFGDLFRSRLCNALHAMPLRREGWFLTHFLSGLTFSIVPNLLVALAVLPRLGGYWYVSGLWLLGMTLHFLFFYGVAIFSVMCTGNRFAMAAVYGILNFASLLVYWFAYTIYEPVLFGISFSFDSFALFCPAVWLSGYEYHTVQSVVDVERMTVQCDGAAWLYLSVAAGVGIVFAVAALLMYRHRALETAGDFMAVRPLAPVFGVMFTLTATAVFAIFGDLFSGSDAVFMVVGFVVGYFTGQMLLRRTVKVFQLKSFLKCAGLGLLLIGSVALTALDPLGVTRWTPRVDQVASASVSLNGYRYSKVELTGEKDVARIIGLHQNVIENGPISDWEGTDPAARSINVALEYTLRDGRHVRRQYLTTTDQLDLEYMKEIFSDPAYVLGYTDWESYCRSVSAIYVDNSGKLTGDACRELLEAMRADGEEGKLAQLNALHTSWETVILNLEVVERNTFRVLRIYSDADNTIRWLKANYDLWSDGTKFEDFYWGS